METIKPSPFLANVLLVDVSDTGAQLVQKFLQAHHINTSCIDHADLAIEKALLHEFAFILFDDNLRISQNVDIVELLKAQDPSLVIVGIISGGKYLSHDLPNLYNKVIENPIQPEVLTQLIHQYVEQGTQQDESELLFSLDSQVIKDMAAEYKVELAKKLPQLKQAFMDNQYPVIMKIAHSIKGSAGNFGFESTTLKAGTLEKMIRQSLTEQISPAFEALILDIETLLEA